MSEVSDGDRPLESVVERVRTIAQVRRVLGNCESAEIQFLLEEFAQTHREDPVEMESRQLTTALRSLDGKALEALLDYSRSNEFSALHQATTSEAATFTHHGTTDKLRLFASHVSGDEGVATSLKDEIEQYGVELFVSTQSIKPDREWALEVEKALSETHGGLAILEEGFHLSAYCQQEVGWMLGARKRVFQLRYDEEPQAMLMKLQAFDARGTTLEEACVRTLSWAAEVPELQAPLTTSLISALMQSSSFHRTDVIWDLLPSRLELGSTQISQLLTAAEDNNQVYNARWHGPDGKSYRQLIVDLLSQIETSEEQSERLANLHAILRSA